ncbi:MAG: hypothetical protein HZB38_08690, partial [Planctomycetes bacterium]|nr:hypothetical protein [Planctomycetota bacterium]
MSTHPAATSLLTPIPSPAFPTHRRSGMTLSMHYFTSSVLWSLALIALLAGWYAVEKWGFHLKGTPMRMVADPTEFGVRIMGIAHFVIAAIFLATSPRLRMAGGWLWLLGLSAAAVLLCWAFSAAGGRQNPIALILFYMFFFIHAFRDEAYFYRIRAGKAVPPEQHTEAVLRWLQVVALCALLALLVSVISVRYSLGFVSVQENALRSLFPASWPFVMVFFATVAPLVVLATIAFARISGQQPGGFAGLVRTHRPLVGVIGGTMAILLASMLLGAWTYNLVILMHFVAWFEYSTVRIRALPRAMRQRSSP